MSYLSQDADTFRRELQANGYSLEAAQSVVCGIQEADRRILYTGLPWERKPLLLAFEWLRNMVKMRWYWIFDPSFRREHLRMKEIERR